MSASSIYLNRFYQLFPEADRLKAKERQRVQYQGLNYSEAQWKDVKMREIAPGHQVLCHPNENRCLPPQIHCSTHEAARHRFY